MQNTDNKETFNLLSILFIITSFLFIAGFMSLLSYDLHNTKKINNELKNELYETKNELKELRKSKHVTLIRCMEDDKEFNKKEDVN